MVGEAVENRQKLPKFIYIADKYLRDELSAKFYNINLLISDKMDKHTAIVVDYKYTSPEVGTKKNDEGVLYMHPSSLVLVVKEVSDLVGDLINGVDSKTAHTNFVKKLNVSLGRKNG